MSKRDWKPGDVAMVTLPGGEQAIGVRPLRNDGWNHSGAFAGGADYDHIGDTDVRPLVVIDPEDREQVERLHGLYLAARETTSKGDLQVALREFANPTPPKPDEPTGLGAVVEDAEGERYVRHGSASLDESVTWCNSTGAGRSWERVNAVRVLSEGVTP